MTLKFWSLCPYTSSDRIAGMIHHGHIMRHRGSNSGLHVCEESTVLTELNLWSPQHGFTLAHGCFTLQHSQLRRLPHYNHEHTQLRTPTPDRVLQFSVMNRRQPQTLSFPEELMAVHSCWRGHIIFSKSYWGLDGKMTGKERGCQRVTEGEYNQNLSLIYIKP